MTVLIKIGIEHPRPSKIPVSGESRSFDLTPVRELKMLRIFKV
jgi:hypothetical protein